MSPRSNATHLLTHVQVRRARRSRIDADFAEINMVLYGRARPPEAEEWAMLLDAPSYEVSSLGHVVRRHFTPLPFQVRGPYLKVRVFHNGQRVYRDVHVLVAEAFLGKRPRGTHVRHLNSHPLCNYINNLVYGTPRRNRHDRSAPEYHQPVEPPLEGWRPHPYYPSLYVSTLGECRLEYFEVISTNGYTYRSGKRTGAKKHIHVAIARRGQRRCYRLLHHLVWNGFHGRIPKELMALHRDGNPHNNRVDNLYLGTAKDNARDMRLHGTRCSANAHPNKKYTLDQVQKLRRLVEAGMPVSKAAREAQIRQPSAYAICQGRLRRQAVPEPARRFLYTPNHRPFMLFGHHAYLV